MNPVTLNPPPKKTKPNVKASVLIEHLNCGPKTPNPKALSPLSLKCFKKLYRHTCQAAAPSAEPAAKVGMNALHEPKGSMYPYSRYLGPKGVPI